MKRFVQLPRVGAFALAAMLAVTACGGSDGADDAAASDAADSVAEADVQSDADTDADTSADAEVVEVAAANAVLEVSASLDIVGEALTPLEDPNNDASFGVMAPVITGQQFDGTDITIGGETDGPTMLVFLAHWCPHCNDEIPELLKLRDAGSLPENLNIIGISTAVDEGGSNYPPSDWIVDKDWTWPVLADTEAAEAFLTYGGTGFPYTVMLFSDGSLNARKSGNESADRILDWIEATLLI